MRPLWRSSCLRIQCQLGTGPLSSRRHGDDGHV